MTDPAATTAQSFSLDPKVAKAFLRFSGGYWSGPGAVQAWLLTLGLAAFLIVSVGATAGLNWWNRWFFDALERRDAATAALAVPAFLGIIAAMAAIGVGIVLTRETLQVRWRAWLVDQLVDRWLGGQRFYHMGVMGHEPANPEYRIADDSRWATEPLTDLAIGLLSAVVGAATFISILWVVGGSYTLKWSTGQLTIPAYMVVLALLYGAIASGLMLLIGRPLVGSVGHKNAAEGHFRAALTRLRENADSIALLGGARSEQAILRAAYGDVVTRWLAVVRQHGRLTWLLNASGPMIPIVPLLFAAPKYLAGDLSLGQVTQLAAAFVQVQMAISWIVDNYNRIAEWYASARRVMDIVDACDAVDQQLPAERSAGIGIHAGAADGLALRKVAVHDMQGRPLVGDADMDLAPGERMHITAASSMGKTLLVRSVAGLWPWGRGMIERPAEGGVMIVPQKTYLPLGSLRATLQYPSVDAMVPKETLEGALTDCGLGHLVPRLERVERWEQVLSNGERQCLAFARILVHRPQVIVFDDAWSALDEATQRNLLAALKRSLPASTVLSLGQRPAVSGFHERTLEITRSDAGAVLAQTKSVPSCEGTST
jgi:vitamin B12/bleomycin/antimicrobial peptide transport system ATP-binding/permease protein